MADESSNKKRDLAVWYIFFALIGLLLLQWAWGTYSQVETIPYSQFDQLVTESRISEVSIGAELDPWKPEVAPPSGRTEFAAARVDPDLAAKLAAHGHTVTGDSVGGLIATLLSWILPAIVFYLIWTYGIRRMAERQGLGGLMTIGKSRAKVYVETDTKVTFADVAGVDEAKFELQEVVAFLAIRNRSAGWAPASPRAYCWSARRAPERRCWRAPSPARRACPFFSISGSEFVEMFVGVGAARVRDLFEQARKAAPCIIFIDELDALGRSRVARRVRRLRREGADAQPAARRARRLRSEHRRDPAGATNRPEVLDPALLRPGRFDRQVLVDRPDRSGRLAILKVHVAKITHRATASISTRSPG